VLGSGEGSGVMGEYHLMAPCKGLVTILWCQKKQILQLILYVKVSLRKWISISIGIVHFLILGAN